MPTAYNLFQREVYLLMTLLMADEKIDSNAIIKEVSLEYYEDEVIWYLLFVAVSARQMLEQKRSVLDEITGELDGTNRKQVRKMRELTEKQKELDEKYIALKLPSCGKYSDKDKDGQIYELSFWDSCCKIIHAMEILPYDKRDVVNAVGLPTDQTPFSGKILYKGVVTVQDRDGTTAYVKMEKFAKYCIILSNSFLLENRHAH